MGLMDNKIVAIFGVSMGFIIKNFKHFCWWSIWMFEIEKNFNSL